MCDRSSTKFFNQAEQQMQQLQAKLEKANEEAIKQAKELEIKIDKLKLDSSAETQRELDRLTKAYELQRQQAQSQFDSQIQAINENIRIEQSRMAQSVRAQQNYVASGGYTSMHPICNDGSYDMRCACNRGLDKYSAPTYRGY